VIRDFLLRVAIGSISAFLAVGAGCGAVGSGGGGEGGTIVEPPSPDDGSACSDEYTMAELAAQAVALGNAERAQAGTPALVVDATLQAVAEDYAEGMATQGFIGHTDPDGNTVRERVLNAGYDWIAVAENLAYGPCTAERAVEGWMDSEGHRTNLLNPTYIDTGVGVYHGGAYEMYWVQVFAAHR
jgi:uncharacterized protein YkwD